MRQYFRCESLETHLLNSRNNFTLIRFILASLVLYGHSFALAKQYSGIEDHIQILLGKHEWIGSVAVNAFFFISGLLIVRSYAIRKDLGQFMKARIFRIFPAFMVCITLGVWVVGSIFTTLPLKDYVLEKGTWDYYIHSLLLWDLRFFLPGLFEGLRNHSINGSIWTLPAELRCYVIVGACGLLGILNRTWRTNLILFVLVILGFWNFKMIPMVSDNPDNLRPAAYFVMGALCFANARLIPIHPLAIIPLAVAYGVFFNTKAHPYLMCLLICYGLLVASYKLPYVDLDKCGDFSYGIYLYAFPVQQVFAASFPKWNAYQNFAASFPTALAFAILSWFLVEKRALALTHKRKNTVSGLVRHTATGASEFGEVAAESVVQ